MGLLIGANKRSEKSHSFYSVTLRPRRNLLRLPRACGQFYRRLQRPSLGVLGMLDNYDTYGVVVVVDVFGAEESFCIESFVFFRSWRHRSLRGGGAGGRRSSRGSPLGRGGHKSLFRSFRFCCWR